MFSTPNLATGLVNPPPRRGVKKKDGIMKTFSKTLAVILAVSAVLVLTGCDYDTVRAMDAAEAAEKQSDAGEGGGHHH